LWKKAKVKRWKIQMSSIEGVSGLSESVAAHPTKSWSHRQQ
jgi:hypothetical protein